jgi:putative flippase GtrA
VVQRHDGAAGLWLGRWVAQLWREGHRYLAVSVAALAVDYAVFVGLVRLANVNYLVGNVCGFVIGVVVAYFGSVFWVFSVRRFSSMPIEFAIFAAAGLGGLVVNSVVLAGAVEWLHIVPEQAKLVAVGASFVFNFLCRKYTLFA